METRYNPVGLLSGVAASVAVADGRARPLSDTGLAFSGIEAVSVGGTAATPVQLRDPNDVPPEALAPFVSARASFAGLSLDRPRVMGVVNVTPDSFSDGGDHAEPAAAIDQALRLAADGADIVDIGGESTRPGAAPISADAELARVMPVIEAAVAAGLTVSVDTRRAAVMRAAVGAGARIVNDVTALTHDADALAAVTEGGASVILMHMQGSPENMQRDPVYRIASLDICQWLEARVAVCLDAGIDRSRIAVDPGIGFGKTDAHNMEILDRAAMLHGLGCAVAVGVSRKSFIGRLAGAAAPRERLPGTIAATLIALSRGVQLHRVHDVAAARQALDIWRALVDRT